MANKTLWDLQTQFYNILREEQDNTAYPITFADELLNASQERICAGTVIDVRTNQAIERMALPFLAENKFYTTSLDTTITQTTSIGATTLYATTTGYPTAGKLWINGNIVTYTGITATSFTGCSGIEYAHVAWDVICRLYDLPTDYLATDRVVYNHNYVMEPKDYRKIFLDLKNYKTNYNAVNYLNTGNNGFIYGGFRPFYSIIQGKYILPFQINQAGYMIRLEYLKQPTEMTQASDESSIPGIRARRTIPYLAVWEMLYNRGEEDRGMRVLWLAYSMIAEMYSYFGNINNETLNNQVISTGKDQILNI